jgi:hypothetical protein
MTGFYEKSDLERTFNTFKTLNSTTQLTHIVVTVFFYSQLNAGRIIAGGRWDI